MYPSLQMDAHLINWKILLINHPRAHLQLQLHAHCPILSFPLPLTVNGHPPHHLLFLPPSLSLRLCLFLLAQSIFRSLWNTIVVHPLLENRLSLKVGAMGFTTNSHLLFSLERNPEERKEPKCKFAIFFEFQSLQAKRSRWSSKEDYTVDGTSRNCDEPLKIKKVMSE